MAFKPPETATLSAAAIADLDDAEVGMFMQSHRRFHGGYELPVDGWDKLSTDERKRLAERLKVIVHSLAHSPTSCPLPLDLDDLDTRLCQVSRNNNSSLEFDPHDDGKSEASTPPLDAEYYRTRDEIEYYHELINDGGRPLYPLDRMQDVYRSPEDYEDVLRPWQECLEETYPDGIFNRQWCRWRDFRKWQNDNRGRDDNDHGGYPGYVEWRKERIRRDYRRKAGAKLLAEIEADPLYLMSDWDERQSLRERHRRLYREHSCNSFDEYAAAVKRRLAQHGFIQQFELDEDSEQQDKLTTWIEYLNYEYWWLDKYTSDIERLEPHHDKAWQELVDSGILRPHETKESVRTSAMATEYQAEDDAARNAVQRAESEAKRIYHATQKDPGRVHIPQGRRISMLRAGSAKLITAKRRFEEIRDRNRRILMFVRGTWGYSRAKRNTTRHQVLVQWVLDQIPMIEAETALSEANRTMPPVPRRMKRRNSTDIESSDTRHSKRAKGDGIEPTGAPPQARETQVGQGAMTDVTGAEIIRRPRRSARIAARQTTVSVAHNPDVSRAKKESRGANT